MATCGFNSNNGKGTHQPWQAGSETEFLQNPPKIPLYQSIAHPNIPYFAYNNFEVSLLALSRCWLSWLVDWLS